MEELLKECESMHNFLGFKTIKEEEDASLLLLKNIQHLNNYKDVTMALLAILAEGRGVPMRSLFPLFDIDEEK